MARKQRVKLVTFIGPQGSGKGEHSRRLHHRIGSERSLLVETSDILRSQNSRQINHLIRGGHIVPDAQVNKVVGRHIKKNLKQVVIVDGFPRTEEQARFLLTEGRSLFGIEKVLVVELCLSDEECLARIHKGKGDGTRPKREDDTEEALKIRLETYRERSGRVIQCLTQAGAIHLSIEPRGDVLSTHAAIAQSVLPHLAMGKHPSPLSCWPH